MMLIETTGAGTREAQRAAGERSEAGAGHRAPEPVPDPQLVERPRRRHFSAEYKLRIVREADGCTRPGQVGALLRREGLYSSHLSKWRAQREEGALSALRTPRGPRPPDPRDVRIANLERRAERAEAELVKARKVIEVQGNVSALLGELLGPRGARENTGR